MCNSLRVLNSQRVMRIRRILSEDGDPAPSVDAKYLVFVFETLMNKKMRGTLLKREVEYDIDEIPDFKEIAVDTIEGENYHTIVSSPDERVRGHVLHLTRDELAILDAWEDQYKRIKVKTAAGRDVFVYVLRVSNIQDHGQNIDVQLNPDDVSMLQAAKDTGDYVLGKGDVDNAAAENITRSRKHNSETVDSMYKQTWMFKRRGVTDV